MEVTPSGTTCVNALDIWLWRAELQNPVHLIFAWSFICIDLKLISDWVIRPQLASFPSARTNNEEIYFLLTNINTKFDWPANSSDPNPIENLWGIVKRKMRDTRPNNADDLKAAIKATWASITPEQCHRMTASMPRLIDAVIHAKEGPTKYWVHRNEHTFQKPDISV